MSDVVIVSAARTPVGSFNGSFSGMSAADLGSIAIKEAINRAKMTKFGIKVAELTVMFVKD